MPKQNLHINNFGLGINNVKNPRDLKNGEMANCENWNISKNGELVPRGEFDTTTDGSAYNLGTQDVDVATASLNAGHGLFYFESDDPVGVRGVTITANGATGTIADDPDGSGEYTICFYGGSYIFVNDNNFWRDTANFYTSSEFTALKVLPFKIVISGAEESSNNGTFTVIDFPSLLDGNQITVESSNSHTMSGNKIGAVLKLAESSLTPENVVADRQITFKEAGIVGDKALALGNVDDGKVDIFFDSNGSWTTDAITLLDVADTNQKPEFVFHYMENVLRVADGNFRNKSTPKWYGFIERNHFGVGLGTSSPTYAHEIYPAFYEENNDLATPTSANYTAEGSLDSATEYPATGAGWGLSVYEDTTESGTWTPATYKFACSFIYDGNQESLLKEFDATQAISTGGSTLLVNVYAYDDGSTHYPNRVTGGRIYIKESDSAQATSVGEAYSLLADIDITKGVRVSLDSEYQAWTTDGAGEYRVTSDTTSGNRGNAHWKLKLKSPNLDTYETINGYSPTIKQIAFGQKGSGYKTSVVAGRRTFVANVMYDEDNTASSDGSSEFKHFGDRIMYSEIGKFDTFPSHNYIDVVLGDGEDYVKLAYFADRILAFKQRTLQVINISSPSVSNWFLEKTVPYAGIEFSYSVCECELGIVWANKNGAYLFDGSSISNITDGKIADDGSTFYSAQSWSGFSSDRTIAVGYIPDIKQAIFVDKVGTGLNAYYYDFRYKAWYYGKYAAPAAYLSGTFSPLMSNMVNDSLGRLVVAYDTQATALGDAGANKAVITCYKPAETGFTYYILQTADYDFNKPGRTKKVYAIYLHYRHSGSSAIDDSKIDYMINNSGTWTAFAGTGNAITQTHATDKHYSVVKLPLVASDGTIVTCQSIAFKFNLYTLAQVSKFAINDIVVEYRVLNKGAA